MDAPAPKVGTTATVRNCTLLSAWGAGRVRRLPGQRRDVDDKLQEIEQRFERLTADLGNPEVIADRGRFSQVAKERAQLEQLVETFREYKRIKAELDEYRAALEDADAEMRAMAREEVPRLQPKVEELNERLKILLLPRDPNDERSVILEVRAGAGGDEAGLFAAELLRMYLRYAERKGWKTSLMDTSDNAAGGIKDASVTIEGDGVFSFLKYESGVHRVQRVPATEAQGRIHTSTATVSVMPEAEEVDVHINPADIQMDVMRSTGSGGQSVNTTDSAVRLTHKPSGVVVKCQQEKSQIKNRAMALKMLRARLYEMEQEKQRSARDAQRKSQVGTGDRSEKIRTYNFPQDRLTDHRIGLTRHNLAAVMDGDIEDMIVACRTFFQAEALRQQQARA
jgi:peptide chain release factor 1